MAQVKRLGNHDLDLRTGIVVFGHGSSVPSANAAVARVAAQAAETGGFPLCETAFLEVAPTLKEATAKLVAAGAKHILVIPYFLTLGIHLQRDLPRMVDDLLTLFPGITVEVTPPLDGHPGLSAIVVERARDAMAAGK
ncbi:MAG: CbiX/SirB N-terminal domain-containing protein [Acidobacteriota bacterium]|nr:CbiX/SirB N-terminal domain-containing protein [Acidobacteriota bacterium]